MDRTVEFVRPGFSERVRKILAGGELSAVPDVGGLLWRSRGDGVGRWVLINPSQYGAPGYIHRPELEVEYGPVDLHVGSFHRR